MSSVGSAVVIIIIVQIQPGTMCVATLVSKKVPSVLTDAWVQNQQVNPGRCRGSDKTCWHDDGPVFTFSEVWLEFMRSLRLTFTIEQTRQTFIIATNLYYALLSNFSQGVFHFFCTLQTVVNLAVHPGCQWKGTKNKKQNKDDGDGQSYGLDRHKYDLPQEHQSVNMWQQGWK